LKLAFAASNWLCKPSRTILNQLFQQVSHARVKTLGPILRLLHLQLQRQRCGSWLEFFKVEENVIVLKTPYATHGDVNFYSSAVVNSSRGICSWDQSYDREIQHGLMRFENQNIFNNFEKNALAYYKKPGRRNG
jgi:hypothetical protein